MTKEEFVIVSDRAPKGEIISGQVPTQDKISIEPTGYKHVNVEWPPHGLG